MSEQSLQDRYAADTICFGCGPINPHGLRIKTFIEGEEGICELRPEPHHEAFEGMLAGGIIGAVFDCHSNWTAAYHLMVSGGLDRPPVTVTAEYGVKLLKPTPTNAHLVFKTRVTEASQRKVTVEGRLEADGVLTATSHGIFVAVKQGHPAFGRW